MESHKAIIPCERCENSSKLHQIKTHLMTPLVIRCRNTCVSENLCVFFFFHKMKNPCKLSEFEFFLFSCSTGLII